MNKRKGETQEEFNLRAAEYMRKRYYETRDWYREYKVQQGCKDCGYNGHHAALQADHLVARNSDESQLIAKVLGRGKAAVLRALKDCEIVCATCHAIRTFERAEALKV